MISPKIRTAILTTAFAAGLIVGTGANAYVVSPLPAEKGNSSVIEAAAHGDAQTFVVEMGNDALAFLADASLSQADKEARFKSLLDDNFDMKTIGRFVLGSYWQRMSEQQRTEYQGLFEKLIVAIYSGRLSEYSGQKFIVDGQRPAGAGAVVVLSHVVSAQSGENIPVAWHVRQKNGQNKIVDVSINDVSLAISKKSEFASIIQRAGGNPETLLAHLREKVG